MAREFGLPRTHAWPMLDRFPYGKAPLAFAYPNGGWNREVAGIVRDAGYRLAFTIEPGAVDCRDDCFNLPRVNIHEGMTRATPMFLARVTGLF